MSLPRFYHERAGIKAPPHFRYKTTTTHKHTHTTTTTIPKEQLECHSKQTCTELTSASLPFLPPLPSLARGCIVIPTGLTQFLLPRRSRPPHPERGRVPPLRLHGREVVPEEARGGPARPREVPAQGFRRRERARAPPPQKAKKKGKRARRREAEEELNLALNQGEGGSGEEDGGETAVTDANNFKICMSYTNLLFFDFIGKQEIVVVEQPWLDVVGKLGEVKDRKVYGA